MYSINKKSRKIVQFKNIYFEVEKIKRESIGKQQNSRFSERWQQLFCFHAMLRKERLEFVELSVVLVEVYYSKPKVITSFN